MATTTEQKIQLLIGGQLISLCELQTQLEQAKERIAELERDKPKPPEGKK